MRVSRRITLLFACLLLIMISIPITLYLVQNKNKQEIRSRASGGTSLSLKPQPGSSNFIEKLIGENVPIDMIIDPGNNAVSFIRFQIKYDPTKLQPVGNTPFVLNTASLPIVLEGPFVNTTDGTISESISAGSDPTKAIQTITKVGTVTFKAIEQTTQPTLVSFTGLTQALSSGSNDQAAENVLASVSPASITINGTAFTPTPTETPLVTSPPTATPTITPTSPPTPTLAPGQTAISFNLLLHGIGAAGDNPNPTGNDLSNKNPRHPQRNLEVALYDSNDQIVMSKSGLVNYDGGTGTFKGQVSLGTNFATGAYIIKIKSDRYLRRLVPGIQTFTNGQNNVIGQTSMVAGDTNGDNTLNVLDYSALLDCGYGEITPLPITNSGAPFNSQVCKVHAPTINIDLDDNGILNAFDYNLFLRELSVQNGD